MKLKEAQEMIENHEKGFMVHFEVRKGGVLHAQYFPEKGEEPIFNNIDKAWEMAERFAKAGVNHNIVNVYVIDQNYSPVALYEEKKLNVYPPPSHNEKMR